MDLTRRARSWSRSSHWTLRIEINISAVVAQSSLGSDGSAMRCSSRCLRLASWCPNAVGVNSGGDTLRWSAAAATVASARATTAGSSAMEAIGTRETIATPLVLAVGHSADWSYHWTEV